MKMSFVRRLILIKTNIQFEIYRQLELASSDKQLTTGSITTTVVVQLHTRSMSIVWTSYYQKLTQCMNTVQLTQNPQINFQIALCIQLEHVTRMNSGIFGFWSLRHVN